jgi:membrane-anchored protein YejM (alkaline phosphatase superfamily)
MSKIILDEAKMNRAIFLATLNILLDDIYLTIESIAKSLMKIYYEILLCLNHFDFR